MTSPAHHSLDYVEISVTDIDAAKRFYGAVLGWTFTDYGPGYCGFVDGVGRTEAGGLSKVDEPPHKGGPLVVVYSKDLEATRASLIEADGNIAKDIFEFPGGRRFEFLDPSGNLLAVWSKV